MIVLPRFAALALVIMGIPSVAEAATYRVGPGQTYRQLTELPALGPGDIVEVMGGADYDGGVVFDFDSDGTAANPVVVRGILDGGVSRPRIAGGRNTIELQGDHYVLENLDISGGTARCVFHHADDIVIRDSVVHDCPLQGILGADQDSGSLTLDHVEVHHCGEGTQNHQIYMATDETAHPGSVFRMQFCWVHDGNGGNGVKSRAERNEIYFNWIEGSLYHELELIGPDGQDEGLAREDSDVVGNVLVKTMDFAVVRFGGDGTGQTFGRYRFAFNTVVLAPGAGAAVFRLFDGIESVEMHDNVFVARDGGGINLLREAEAAWVHGRTVAGTHNWVPTGSTNVPPEWTGTLMGTSPGLGNVTDLAALDLVPTTGSPLIDAGDTPPVFAGSPFPSPLDLPGSSPSRGAGEVVRPAVGAIDIGAYEFGSGPPRMDAGTSDVDAAVLPGTDAGPGIDAGGTAGDAGPRADGGAATTPASGGCGCRAGAARDRLAAVGLALLVLVGASRRRRAR